MSSKSIRFRVEPRDVPDYAAARRMGLTLAEFNAVLDRLYRRGFPRPDPDTGKFDLDAIDQWRKLRHPRLFGLSRPSQALNAQDVVMQRIKAFRADRSKA